MAGDDPFARTPGGRVPTARAEATAPRVAQALALAAKACADPTPFDPTRAQATVRIMAPDGATLTLAPVLAPPMAAEAPGIDLRFGPTDRRTRRSEMDASAALWRKLTK